jgi:hypothetical protein
MLSHSKAKIFQNKNHIHDYLIITLLFLDMERLRADRETELSIVTWTPTIKQALKLGRLLTSRVPWIILCPL